MVRCVPVGGGTYVYLQACVLGFLHGVSDRIIYLSSASDVCFGHSLLVD